MGKWEGLVAASSWAGHVIPSFFLGSRWMLLKIIIWFFVIKLSYWILLLCGKEKIIAVSERLLLLQVTGAPHIKVCSRAQMSQMYVSQGQTLSCSKTPGFPPQALFRQSKAETLRNGCRKLLLPPIIKRSLHVQTCPEAVGAFARVLREGSRRFLQSQECKMGSPDPQRATVKCEFKSSSI